MPRAHLPTLTATAVALIACTSTLEPSGASESQALAPVPRDLSPDAGICPNGKAGVLSTVTCSYWYRMDWSDNGSTCTTYEGNVDGKPATFYQIQCATSLTCKAMVTTSGGTPACNFGAWLEGNCPATTTDRSFENQFTSTISSFGDCPEDPGAACIQSASTSQQPSPCPDDTTTPLYRTCCLLPIGDVDLGDAGAFLPDPE